MPELPEIETIKRGLEPNLVGLTIEHVTLNRDNLRYPFPPLFAELLTNKKITSLARRAKYLLINLEDNLTLIIHLGMSGRIILMHMDEYEPKKHDHVLFDLSDEMILVFNDPRRFGMMDLHETNKLEDCKHLKHLAPEPLSNEFDMDYLYNALKKRNSPIKLSIMNQELVVGVGNIYASESLFLSNISPLRQSSKVTKIECDKLVKNIRITLNSAIHSGGSTLRDFVGADGESGYFQHKFQVYGRENELCVKCKSKIIKIVQSNRSSFYCKKCQR